MYAPWRLAFLQGQAANEVPSPTGCIFCDYAQGAQDQRAWDQRRLVVTQRAHAFVILNKYPYSNGHVMVVPRVHTDQLETMDDATSAALQALLRETIAAVREVYRPDGLNIGMNMGEAAGAGIAGHIHWHVLPRWRGDVNFMPALADTKVISESLTDCWHRLAQILRRAEEE